MSKALFLDFDGVIRILQRHAWLCTDEMMFCGYRIDLISDICERLGVKIVISSDWRKESELFPIQQILGPRSVKHLHPDWMTPIKGHRWVEIGSWLAFHPEVEEYAILDDVASLFDGAPPEMLERLILCNNRHGLVPSLAEKLETLLK